MGAGDMCVRAAAAYAGAARRNAAKAPDALAPVAIDEQADALERLIAALGAELARHVVADPGGLVENGEKGRRGEGMGRRGDETGRRGEGTG